MAAADIPMDVMYDILRLLPVKSLLRFKSVCKAWRDCIDSSRFIQSHHSYSANRALFLVYTQDQYPTTTPHQPPLLSPAATSIIRKLVTNTPHDHHQCFITIVGSCNGLVCLDLTYGKPTLALCNPSTRAFKKVPYPSYIVHDYMSASRNERFRFGFGYDCHNNDYKIIGVSTCRIIEACVLIYSLRANLWRKVVVQLGPEVIHQPSYGTGPIVLAKNCLHWIIHCHKKVVSFDLHTESLRLVPLPSCYDDQDYETYYSVMHSGVFDGCFCLQIVSTNFAVHSRHELSDIWVMKEYGISESWTKLFRISSHEIVIPLSFTYCESRSEILLLGNFGSLFRGKLRQAEKTNDGVAKFVSDLIGKFGSLFGGKLRQQAGKTNDGDAKIVFDIVKLDGYGGVMSCVESLITPW